MPKDVQQRQVKGDPNKTEPVCLMQDTWSPSVSTLSTSLSPLHEAVSHCHSATRALTCMNGTSRATDVPNTLSIAS